MPHDKTIKSAIGREILSRVRTICKPLPGVDEQVDGFGHTSFRVANKPFVMMGENEEGGDPSLSLKTDHETQDILLQQGGYTKTHYIGQHGWVTVRSMSEPDWHELEQLIVEGYRRVAPKKLVRQIDEQ